jgi:4'-phosphopantetheinyl transferase
VPSPLPIDHVDLWTVALTVGPEQYASLAQSLCADEQARADRFKFERDRRRYTVGRGTLRNILASYIGCRAEQIRFAYGPHGKPTLANAAREQIEFNASGSEDLAVCAVTVGRSVGVDIEFCRPITDNSFLDQCLTAAERKALSALEPDRQLAAFYRLWTLKEALLKATGDGLSRPMTTVEFDITITADSSARLVGDPDLVSAEPSWDFAEFAPGRQYAGAVVVSGGGCRLNYRT